VEAIAEVASKCSQNSFDALRSVLENLLLNFSFFDLTSENAYHVLFMSTIVSASWNNVLITSNVESGHGRYDIALEFTNLRHVVIFELKKAASEAEMDNSASIALSQIQDKKYYDRFFQKHFDCILVGVSFFSKKVSLLKTAIVHHTQ
jgi:hypothetical protein